MSLGKGFREDVYGRINQLKKKIEHIESWDLVGALGDLSDVTATGEGSGGGFDADTVDGSHAAGLGAAPQCVIAFFTGNVNPSNTSFAEQTRYARAYDLNWSNFSAGTFAATLSTNGFTGSARVRDVAGTTTYANVATSSSSPVRLTDTSVTIPADGKDLMLETKTDANTYNVYNASLAMRS